MRIRLRNEKIFITMNDMMLGILQEEERSFEDSEKFSVKLICIYVLINIFLTLSYTKEQKLFRGGNS
ncbi:hypothetical protein Avbf_18356 [Armadillidium vulgare]|nr:hypothetical protein Avbf_18356 [Armadillidium vulgare]